MLTLPLAQSDNILPSNPKSWKIETFQNESGFILKKVNVECVQLGHYENDYRFPLQRLQVDNCYFKMGHWLFDGMVLMVNWDLLRMIIASDWIVANFPNQSTSFSPLLSIQQLRWHLPPQGRKFPDRKAPRFVWCKAIYGSICYVAVTKLRSISTWWSKTIPHICHRHHRRCLCKKRIAQCKFLQI